MQDFPTSTRFTSDLSTKSLDFKCQTAPVHVETPWAASLPLSADKFVIYRQQLKKAAVKTHSERITVTWRTGLRCMQQDSIGPTANARSPQGSWHKRGKNVKTQF